MENVKILVKDQVGIENIVVACLRPQPEQHLSLFDRIDHIIIDGEEIMPNMDLLFENSQNNKIFKVIGLAE